MTANSRAALRVIQSRLSKFLERLQLRLSGHDAPLPLALLGIASGLLAGGVMIVFRLLVEGAQTGMLPAGQVENYEALHWAVRLLLTLAGALVVGLIFRWAGKSASVGVVHVMERLAYHQGYISLKSTALQFVGAALSIISGQSVGREGPSVHMGAGSASLLGQGLHLPNNSIRTLVACGTAASISASFNTPLAGVVFAMEVVMMEYTIAAFTPVILAAVIGAVLTRAIYGNAPAFVVPALQLGSNTEILFLLLIAVVIGTLASLFITLVQQVTNHTKEWPILLRFGLAGLSTGLLAIAVPEIMGIGYDTVGLALGGQLELSWLLAIAAVKLLATGLAIGLALPGGLIGPTFVIGATAGGAMGLLANMLFATGSSPGFYAMLGMGAMMGATLQAPLAALIALLELTSNPHIILPGMLVVIGSNLVASQAFGKKSIFLTLFIARGLSYRHNPVLQTLRSAAVASVMERNFVRTDPVIRYTDAHRLLEGKPHWIIIDKEGKPDHLLPAADLAALLKQAKQEAAEAKKKQDEGEPKGAEQGPGEQTIDLMEIPAKRLQLGPVKIQATLYEALKTLDEGPAEALYVERTTAPGIRPVQGIVTRSDIEESYRY